ncbi:T9SS type A sorting domain-containing protein [Flavobacterium sp.]|uniref:T9SS type A sorting domain-containing protein n=1 Tax=Flavobacterium sp. TaxID=239 RepID=UPI0026123924|nr:T9SS type A sorting domain-containing protein [Flavobacterium sp.]
MKKTALLFCAFLLLMSTNLFAALTGNLQFSPALGTSIVVYPNSTVNPANYEVRISVSSYSNTFCAGTFSLTLERRNVTGGTSGTWGTVVPNTAFPNLGVVESYSGTCMIYQAHNTKFEYRVKIVFNPTGASGTTCATMANETKTTNEGSVQVKPKAVPDFTVNGIAIPADASPIGICLSQTLYMHAGITANESDYFMGVTESNRWWESTGNLSWGGWFAGQAPDYIPVQDKMLQNISYFTAPTPAQVTASPSLVILKSGTLQSPPSLAGQDRYYRLQICVGEPEWTCKMVLVRLDAGCRTATVVGVAEGEIVKDLLSEEATSGTKLFPNPVKDIVKIDTKEKVMSYRIYDLSNTIVKAAENKKGSDLQQVDLNDLQQGLYVIEITTEKGVERHRIIKE